MFIVLPKPRFSRVSQSLLTFVGFKTFTFLQIKTVGSSLAWQMVQGRAIHANQKYVDTLFTRSYQLSRSVASSVVSMAESWLRMQSVRQSKINPPPDQI